MDVETIHNSLINGQRQQAFIEIIAYGPEQFFKDFKAHLLNAGWNPENVFEHYSDAVECFVARIDL